MKEQDFQALQKRMGKTNREMNIIKDKIQKGVLLIANHPVDCFYYEVKKGTYFISLPGKYSFKHVENAKGNLHEVKFLQ